MTDFAVVVVFCLVIRDGPSIGHGRPCPYGRQGHGMPCPYRKRSVHEQRLAFRNSAARNHVLMLVMRKFNHELSRADRITKSKARIMTRRHCRVADATDNRARASEKLRPVATHTRIVTGIIGDVGEVSYLSPVFSRRFMTGVAGGLVFGCRV